MRIANVKIALYALLVAAIVVCLFAFVYSQTLGSTKQIQAGIVVRYPMLGQFGVYWNYECTNPVTSIDFGEVPQPRNWMYLSKTFYIRNEQVGHRIWVYWNSTLRDVTTEISESWISNGTIIESGSVYYAYYSLSLPPNATLGTYNWTLTIWAEY